MSNTCTCCFRIVSRWYGSVGLGLAFTPHVDRATDDVDAVNLLAKTHLGAIILRLAWVRHNYEGMIGL